MTRVAHRPTEPQHMLANVRSWPSELARSWTLTAMRVVETDTAVRAVVASGSAVRDVEQSDDLDLLVVFATRRPSLPRAPLDVDLRLYEETELLCKLEAGHDYLSWTIRYGHVLFEREAWWTRLSEAWIDRLVLPSADDARERARKAKRLYDDVVAIGDHDAAAELRVSMLTNLARAALTSAGVFPKSRPELAEQLRGINNQALADRLAYALAHRYG